MSIFSSCNNSNRHCVRENFGYLACLDTMFIFIFNMVVYFTQNKQIRFESWFKTYPLQFLRCTQYCSLNTPRYYSDSSHLYIKILFLICIIYLDTLPFWHIICSNIKWEPKNTFKRIEKILNSILIDVILKCFCDFCLIILRENLSFLLTTFAGYVIQ